VFRLERTVRVLTTGKLRHEVVYGLSSLSMRQAPAPRHTAPHQGSLGYRKSAPLEACCHARRRCMPNAHRTCS
jgi:hypothetical protein